MAAAKWTTKRTEIAADSYADGSFVAEVPLYDNGVKQLTLRLSVDANRAVRIDVRGEPGATLTGFSAWSDL